MKEYQTSAAPEVSTEFVEKETVSVATQGEQHKRKSRRLLQTFFLLLILFSAAVVYLTLAGDIKIYMDGLLDIWGKVREIF